MLKTLAGWIAHSPFCRRGRDLMDQNTRNWSLPLSKWQKLQAGTYLILSDYSQGRFPPEFKDQAAAYAAEAAYRHSLPGLSSQHISSTELRKPFWGASPCAFYFEQFTKLSDCLEKIGRPPPARLLELGCGTGWMSEFLALMGYNVTGTTLAEVDITDARKRIASVEAKELRSVLRYEAAPMETVAEVLGEKESYDVVFVFEALHHAFDWRKAIASSHAALKPGGWLLICCEPNLIHTFSSYRIARLSNTHEIGFSRRELVSCLREVGFNSIRSFGTRFHFMVAKHWLAARKVGPNLEKTVP
jgi:2-polyprenyl-3-methyl-5-hydroxy-6-metoxy-1,4-benzoquinol methylase